MHCELLAVLQVSALVHMSTAVHVGHVSGDPSSRYRPLAHEVHCDVVAEEHVIGELEQPVIGGQVGQLSATLPPGATSVR